MSSTKIIGWITFLAGILIIVFALYSSYNIFTAKTEVPEIFKTTKTEAPLTQKTQPQDLQTQIEGMMEEMIGEQLKELLPVDVLPKLLNLVAWSIFAGILIFAGSQVSGLGIKLIKD